MGECSGAPLSPAAFPRLVDDISLSAAKQEATKNEPMSSGLDQSHVGIIHVLQATSKSLSEGSNTMFWAYRSGVPSGDLLRHGSQGRVDGGITFLAAGEPCPISTFVPFLPLLCRHELDR